MKEIIKSIAVSELQPFPGNPFSIREDNDLRESIRDYGVISPLVVRPLETGGYEIISGHRRKTACEELGIENVPAFVREMDDNAAVIALVDSNLHREQVLPSEKAFAYKMKLEAIKKQGQRTDLTYGQVEQKLSRDAIGEDVGKSGATIQRYIRLTELIPDILQMVDDGKVAFSPAVELSYLNPQEQADLYETMQSEERTPNLSQAQRLKKLSADGELDIDRIFSIMSEEKANQKEQIKLKTETIKGYFPKGYTPLQMHDTIIRLLTEWQQKRERASRNRDAR
jgi:ParB family chromosome partitioning protein